MFGSVEAVGVTVEVGMPLVPSSLGSGMTVTLLEAVLLPLEEQAPKPITRTDAATSAAPTRSVVFIRGLLSLHALCWGQYEEQCEHKTRQEWGERGRGLKCYVELRMHGIREVVVLTSIVR